MAIRRRAATEYSSTRILNNVRLSFAGMRIPLCAISHMYVCNISILNQPKSRFCRFWIACNHGGGITGTCGWRSSAESASPVHRSADPGPPKSAPRWSDANTVNTRAPVRPF